MSTYILRRLLQFVPVLLGVSIVIFVLMRIVPGDVAVAILAGPDGSGSVNPAALEELREKLGLNRSLPAQYVDWIWGFLRGDWGDSYRSNASILSEIRTRLPLTFEMATLTVAISLLIGLPSGIIMAIRQNTWIDYLARILSIGGLTMPTFWVATLMLLIMVVWFGWSPPLDYAHFWNNPWKNIQQVIWGALAMGYLFAAIFARMTRSALLEVLRQDYVRTAWSKGLSERTVVVRHALKNSLLPIVTIVGVQYATLLGGTVIMERIWNLPGLGSSLVDAVDSRDIVVVQDIVLVFAVIVLLVNLAVDIMYAWLDPRVRYG